MKKKRYMAAIIVFFSVIIIGCAVMGISAIATTASTDNDKICEGVYIDTVYVGGMTAEQAEVALDEYLKSRENKQLTVKVDTETVKTNLNAIGYSCEENNYIEQALQVGKTGNLIKRYKELRDIEEEKLVYELEFQFDDAKIKKMVKKKCSAFDVAAKDATMKRENGAFVYTDEKVGRKVVVDDTVQKIKTIIEENKDDNEIVVEAVIIDDIPKHTKETLSQIDDIIGSYSTTYHDSSSSRATNLANSAKFINGTVLYPGDVFSCYEHMNPFTAANGYMPAGAYLQGKVVDSIGGGVCQVSSTLYNAVLLAELEVVERAPHSMSVGYVKPSADAAIAGTFKDLKFKNNLEDPIYIEAFTEGRTIKFNIYGNDKRDIEHRTIEYVSKVIASIAPPKEVVTEDPTQPPSYRRVTQSAHTGSRAELYKVVYIDGVESERILINTSSYAAAPAYVTVGTKEEEKEEDPEKEEPDKEDPDKKEPDKEDPDKKEPDKVDTKKPEKEDTNKDNSKKEDTNSAEKVPVEEIPIYEDEFTDDTGEVIE